MEGMIANSLRRGSLVDGARVVRRCEPILNGVRRIKVVLSDGRERLYFPTDRVPGTRPRTDMPAGPLPGKGVSTQYTRGARRGRDEDRGDYHSRLIELFTLATA